MTWLYFCLTEIPEAILSAQEPNRRMCLPAKTNLQTPEDVFAPSNAQYMATQITENQADMISQQETSKAPVTKPNKWKKTSFLKRIFKIMF